MIILDTNIVSEFMGRPADPRVADWLNSVPETDVHLTAILVAEIWRGLIALPDGQRRRGLERDYRSFRARFSQAQILSFDEASAIEYAEIGHYHAASGRHIKAHDAQIAAIARRHAASLATRNTKDFANCDLTVIDPFTYRA